ncbi:response regulator [Nonlabens marinus]|uniref:Response regulator n=1 Tax=Nonlabens marinus S1-08 TaxID=1454201 RepID=W8VZI5_9FLAO|nr:response regulator [Nonlabens marinus]BAO54636.1 response regulator [Nonlabens marinus S1-08]
MKVNYVWIIDDDAVYTFTVRKLLEQCQLAHTVKDFKNGQLAIDQLTEINFNTHLYPDIILLDINMPVLNGWQFMNEFVKFVDKNAITVYMVSSSIDPRDRERAMQYEEIEDFVIKPLTIKCLRDLLSVSI